MLGLLGFTVREATVYLTLLRKGPITTYELARVSRMNRSGLYETLTRMLEKGFLSEQVKDGRKLFVPVDAGVILEVQRLKLEKAEHDVAGLKKLYSESETTKNVQVFSGKTILKILIKDILRKVNRGDKILSIAIHEEESLEIDPIFLKQYLTTLREMHVTELVLAREGSSMLPEAKKESYRFLPAHIIGSHPYAIYAGTVSFFNNDAPPTLIIVRSKRLAESFRLQFEHFWKLAKSSAQ